MLTMQNPLCDDISAVRRRRNSAQNTTGLTFVFAALAIVLPGVSAEAAENGAAHYPTGTNTIVPALMPPPGTSLWLMLPRADEVIQ